MANAWRISTAINRGLISSVVAPAPGLKDRNSPLLRPFTTAPLNPPFLDPTTDDHPIMVSPTPPANSHPPNDPNLPLTRIAIIGAGASGLCQLKQVLDAFDRPSVKRRRRLEVVLFEKRDEVGGAWAMHKGKKEYLVAGLASSSSSAPETSNDYAPPSPLAATQPSPSDPTSQSLPQRPPSTQSIFIYPHSRSDCSPMYPGLRTNLPSDLMAFRDLALPPAEAGSMFPTGERILQYLQDYCTTFGLDKYMRLGTRVVRLRLNTAISSSGLDTARDGGGVDGRGGAGRGEKGAVDGELEGVDGAERPRRWSLTWADKRDGQEQEETFDFVCVANGHYSDAWIPPIPGLETWTRTITHSQFYNGPAQYAGQNVLVVGSFASGSDVVRQLAQCRLEHSQHASETRSHPADSPSPPSASSGDKVYASADYSLSTTLIPRSSPSPAPSSHPPAEPAPDWMSHVHSVPLISHITSTTVTRPPGGSEGRPNTNTIHFKPFEDGTAHPPVEDVDVLIFATGYNYALPFLKRTDQPWAGMRGDYGETMGDGAPEDHRVDAGLELHTAINGLNIQDGENGDGHRPNGVHMNGSNAHSNSKRGVLPLNRVIEPDERQGGGAIHEAGGLRGSTMKGLDEFLFFLRGDRSICFPALPYSIVPFPLAECQARLSALLWAGVLPHFPDHPQVPQLKGNPYWDQEDIWPSVPLPATAPPNSKKEGVWCPAISPSSSRSESAPSYTASAGPEAASQSVPEAPSPESVPQRSYPPPSIRKSTSMREKLIFSSPATPFYEFKYEEYMMRLMREADEMEGWETPECWRAVEELRYERRKGGFELRKEVLGY